MIEFADRYGGVGDLGAAAPGGDEHQQLGPAFRRPVVATGSLPTWLGGTGPTVGGGDHLATVVDAVQGIDQFVSVELLGQVAVGDELGV